MHLVQDTLTQQDFREAIDLFQAEQAKGRNTYNAWYGSNAVMERAERLPHWNQEIAEGVRQYLSCVQRGFRADAIGHLYVVEHPELQKTVDIDHELTNAGWHINYAEKVGADCTDLRGRLKTLLSMHRTAEAA